MAGRGGHRRNDCAPAHAAAAAGGGGGEASASQILAVQTAAALAAGCTSATLTTPLDVVKTRLQVAGAVGAARPSAAAVVRRLLAEDGVAGLFRGLGPRTASVALWGTCMVNAYEGLKRAAARRE